MAGLEDLRCGATCCGLTPDGPVTIVQVVRHWSGAPTVVYRDGAGDLEERIVLRSDEERLRIVRDPQAWPLDADEAAFRPATEALSWPSGLRSWPPKGTCKGPWGPRAR